MLVNNIIQGLEEKCQYSERYLANGPLKGRNYHGNAIIVELFCIATCRKQRKSNPKSLIAYKEAGELYFLLCFSLPKYIGNNTRNFQNKIRHPVFF
jgi:hypothetical protein